MNELEVKKKAELFFSNSGMVSKFYKFRFYNQQFDFNQSMQIFLTNPNVKLCKTFDEWNALGRRVSKGEKSIVYYDEDNPTYRHHIFDISQTYGYYLDIKVNPRKKEIGKFIDTVNTSKQNYLGKEEYEILIQAIQNYCEENNINKSNEEENKFLYFNIANYINSAYSNSTGILALNFETDIDLDRKILLSIEAENISKDIISKAEKKEEENKKRILENGINNDTNEQSDTGKVWGIRIRNAEAKETHQVSLFDTYSGDRQVYNELAEPNGRNGTDIGDGISTKEQYAEQVISSETTLSKSNKNDDRRDNLQSNRENYRLSEIDFVFEGGAKTRFKNNVEAIKLLKTLQQENRQATSGEQKILAKYTGWGAISQAFDELNENWQKEYKTLKELLSDDEYKDAKGSVLNAHFTSKEVIDGIYKIVDKLGLKDGKILEPACGIGNFIGLKPNEIKDKQVYGVEIDNLTGEIAKQLYPNSNIQVCGFEDTNFENDEFDLVVGNVPFGSYKVYDKDYNKYNFYIHDYFILKSIDKIKPNGLCAVITSKGTMDKLSTEVRKTIADKAKLIGAIRLPNNAFKENAGTEVTADILIFQKREEIIDSQDSWINTSTNSDGITMNNYFIEHPEMICGTMRVGKSMYGNENETYCEPNDKDITTNLENAISYLPENIYKTYEKIKVEENIDTLPVDYNIRNYCYEEIDNKIYMRVNNQMVLQNISQKNFDRFSALIKLRKQIRKLLNVQIDNCDDETLANEQSKLNTMYDKFVKKYGYLNSKFNRNLFRQDGDFALLVASEDYNETQKKATKTDIFTKRTIRKHEIVNKASDAKEALQISKNELGKVDLRYIEKLTKLSYDEILNQLKGLIFKNPISDVMLTEEDSKYLGWETADEYLSGDVRKKLNVAQQAQANNPMYADNVVALESCQPEKLTASDISVRMGANWVDADIYKQFIIDILQLHPYQYESLEVNYNHYNGEWKVSTSAYRHDLNATSIYGTSRMDAYRIIEHTLNLQTPTVYDKVTTEKGEERVVNKKETTLAREKQNKIQQKFKEWIFDDVDRRNMLVEKYNNLFNSIRLQEYNGDYLTFPEMNPEIELKKHQKDAVARIITSGNTLLAHVVGAGKTFEMVAAAMKLKQYGLAHKPMIVVPNHLVMQWTREFKTLYPNANVLMATKKDLVKENRLKFVSRVATGDWDAVIIAASSFEKIPISKERQVNKIQSEVDKIQEELERERENEYRYYRKSKTSVKILERVLKDKQAQLKKLVDTPKDDLIKFEDLGVDYLFVDEAHKYKNKFIFTKMNNVAGISKAMSQRATDLETKCNYINELHNGNKGVVFATGTPISNSMVEMFTMQSYLQNDMLIEKGLNYFDAWAANFGETETALELAPSGQGYRTRTRFSKFTNLPELLKMYRSFADIKTADMLKLPVPEYQKETIIAKPSDDILRLNEVIMERSEAINSGHIQPEVDNMLKITSDGKKLALDPRCFDETSNDSIGNKVNLCVDNVYNIWKENTDKRSTQIIFCDLSTPTKSFEDYDPETDFDIYNDIKTKLVNKGIPASEIRFIHEAKTDLQKQSLFDDVNQGNVRVLLGSTEKCGAGTNIQKKLIALHHLDTPYRPSDLEQREGRIIRQGNSNKLVHIYTYVTERTFDSYSYQILENKQKFISQIDSGNLVIREASDIDDKTMSYAEIKAIATANPEIKRKMELEQELARLEVLEGEYRTNKYYLQDQIATNLPALINQTKNFIDGAEKDIEIRNNNKYNEFTMTIGNTTFTERKAAGTILLNLIHSNQYNGRIVGKICGLNIAIKTGSFLDENRKVMIGNNSFYNVEVSADSVGTIIKIENAVNAIDEILNNNKNNLENLYSQLESAKQEVNKPFSHEQDLLNLRQELAEVNASLDLNKKEIVVLDENENQNDTIIELPEEKENEELEESEDEQEYYEEQYQGAYQC